MLNKIALALLAAATLSIATPALAADYLGNPKTMKFHYANCRTIRNPQNFVHIGSRDEAINAGYKPCGICRP